MTSQQISDQPGSLRDQAERAVSIAESVDASTLSPAQIRRLVHELRVHQIELDMQNEELRRAQHELEASRDKYFRLYDLAPIGYVTINRVGTILEANLTAADMLGTDRSGLLQQRLTRFIAPNAQDTFYQARRRLFATGQSQSYELPMVRLDGSPFHAHVQSITVRDTEGWIQCWSAITDISERRKEQDALQAFSERMEELAQERALALQGAQLQALRSEKMAMLGQLAGSVGHDLRNPLGVISNAAYLLKMVCTDQDPTVRGYLTMIEDATRAAAGIVSDLLGYAHPHPPNLTRVTVASLVENALSKIPPPKAVRVGLEIPSALPAVQVDPQQIERVLINLISNAYEAMAEGGTLTIRAAAEQNAVALSFTDTGCGISPEFMDRLFEPLFTTKPNGIGLGLVATKTLVETNGGAIKVESKVGQGSTFTVKLPIR